MKKPAHWKHNPGSDKAVENGCTCAVLDNEYGAGIGYDGEKWGWYITAGCPLHDKDEVKDNEKKHDR